MVFFNHATRQMTAKIVYYGPGLCGKTTNLNTIYAKTSLKSRGEMVSLNTETDRTLFFDLLPMDVGVVGGFKTKLQLYTVPGQVFYNSTRKLVLKGVDGIVFVVDSQAAMLDASKESLENLEQNLKELGLDIKQIPMVFQYNKRDLKNVLPLQVLEKEINPRGLPSFESVASEGTGVFETLRGITKLALSHIKTHVLGESAAPSPAPKPAPPPQVPLQQPPPMQAASPLPPSQSAPAPKAPSLTQPIQVVKAADLKAPSQPVQAKAPAVIPVSKPTPAGPLRMEDLPSNSQVLTGPTPPVQSRPPHPVPSTPQPANPQLAQSLKQAPSPLPDEDTDVLGASSGQTIKPAPPQAPAPSPAAPPKPVVPPLLAPVPTQKTGDLTKRAPSATDALQSLLGELTNVGKIGAPATLRLEIPSDFNGQDIEVLVQIRHYDQVIAENRLHRVAPNRGITARLNLELKRS